MNQLNAHEVMLGAWSKVMLAVLGNQLDPQTVTWYLEQITEGKLQRTMESLEQLVGSATQFQDRLNGFLGELQGNVGLKLPNEAMLLNRPVADLNLSVRARKAMLRLGITTFGELVQKTGDDLRASKNFGMTALAEVRSKLADHGLKLRGD